MIKLKITSKYYRLSDSNHNLLEKLFNDIYNLINNRYIIYHVYELKILSYKIVIARINFLITIDVFKDEFIILSIYFHGSDNPENGNIYTYSIYDDNLIPNLNTHYNLLLNKIKLEKK